MRFLRFLIIGALIFSSLSVVHAQSDLTDFVPDEEGAASGSFTLDQDGLAGAGDSIVIEFGAVLGETLQFDVDDDRFELSNDLSLEGNELESFRIENLASDPATCDGTQEGRLYYNTGSDELQLCADGNWGAVGSGGGGSVDQTNIVYVDGTRATQTGEVYATLAAAAAYVSGQTPSSGNRWVILMEPRTNTENVTIPTFTHLVGRDRQSTIFTGTLTLSANSALQGVTVNGGGEVDIPNGSTGYVSDADVNIDDGASGGIDGTLVIHDSFVDGEIGVTGAVMAYNSVIGPTALTNDGSLATYHSTVLTLTNNNIWNNFASAYNNADIVDSADRLDATDIQGAIDELVFGTPSDFFTIDENQGGAADVTLEFGSVVNETLSWDNTNDYFLLSDALVVDGNVNVQGTTLRLDSDEAGNPDQDVDIIAEQGTEDNGILRYDDGNNRWEFSNDGGTSFTPLGGVSSRKNGFITLTGGVTGSVSVTGVGFQANFVEFTLNNDIEGENFDAVSAGNNNTEQGSFGWGKGYAFDNGISIEQQAQFFSASSNSINAHRGFSSNTQSILIVASDQNGNDVGRIEGTVSSFGSNGFDLNISTNTFSGNYVMMYSAQVFSGTEIIFQDQGTNDVTFTIDQDNMGAGADVSIVAEQGTDNNGVLRYNATSNQWELSNNGGGYVPLAGWHGSQTRIKLLPTDFMSDDADDNGEISVQGEFVEASSGTTDLTAIVSIPTGFRATHVLVYGEDTGNPVTVYANSIVDNTTATNLGSGNVGTEINIIDLDSSTTNYLSIAVDTGNNDQLYGGYVTIQPIP